MKLNLSSGGQRPTSAPSLGDHDPEDHTRPGIRAHDGLAKEQPCPGASHRHVRHRRACRIPRAAPRVALFVSILIVTVVSASHELVVTRLCRCPYPFARRLIPSNRLMVFR